jgi:hypothetical protein
MTCDLIPVHHKDESRHLQIPSFHAPWKILGLGSRCSAVRHATRAGTCPNLIEGRGSRCSAVRHATRAGTCPNLIEARPVTINRTRSSRNSSRWFSKFETSACRRVGPYGNCDSLCTRVDNTHEILGAYMRGTTELCSRQQRCRIGS